MRYDSLNWSHAVGECVSNIELAFREVTSIIEEIDGLEDRNMLGGYLTLCGRNSEGKTVVIFQILVGNNPVGKEEPRRMRSLEKAERLFGHPEHFTSFESRNPDEGRWGGAIRVSSSDLVISFSGFPEPADELFVYLIASWSKLLTESEKRHIASLRKNNKYFVRAFDD
jgi:hypothetical protein